MRGVVLVTGSAIAALLYFIGAGFSLNGPQWSWWSHGAWTAAIAAVVAAIWLAFGGRQSLARRLRRDTGVAALMGVILVTVSTTVMARRYSDPYSGPQLWPRVLAVIASVGAAAVAVSLVVNAAATSNERRP
jgi:uncharacterized membrane protein YhaH (DUF805 family)